MSAPSSIPASPWDGCTPIYKDRLVSERRAAQVDGKVVHLVEPPEYHGNPIDPTGSLVTFHYGHDLPDLIASWASFDVEVIRFNDREHGIVGEFTEVIVCRKRAPSPNHDHVS